MSGPKKIDLGLKTAYDELFMDDKGRAENRLAQAIKMRKFSSEGKLNEDVILSIMCEAKPNQREKFSFPADRLRRLLPSGITMKQTEEYVVKALEFYQHYLDRQRDSGRSR